MSTTPRVAIRKAETAPVTLTEPVASPADPYTIDESQPPRRPSADNGLIHRSAPLLRSRR
jgi:hypothetical protein